MRILGNYSDLKSTLSSTTTKSFYTVNPNSNTVQSFMFAGATLYYEISYPSQPAVSTFTTDFTASSPMIASKIDGK